MMIRARRQKHFISPFLLFHCVRVYPPLLWHDCWNGVYERTESRQKCCSHSRVTRHTYECRVCLSVCLYDMSLFGFTIHSGQFGPGIQMASNIFSVTKMKTQENRDENESSVRIIRHASPIGERDYSTYFIRRESNFMVYVPWKKVPQRLSCTS